MPQDSGKDIPLSSLSFQRPIPKAVREFGRAIDPDILMPGDLMLFARKMPNWTSRRITKYQEKMFSREHACWYHAAVSGGRYEICEATTWGVKAHEYWNYMTGEYDIKVRRLKGATAEERGRLAYYAASNVDSSYGFLNLFNVAAALRGGSPWSRPFIISQGVICSQLYFEAAMRVGFLLAATRSEFVCPAHLSISTVMEDVPIIWAPV